MDAQTFKEWQDPEINAVNRAPMHTNFFAYESTEAATEAVKEKSANFMTLNGIWKFRWVKDSDARPTDFWKIGYNDKGWDDLPIPAMWELNGYDVPLYSGVGFDWKLWKGWCKNNPPVVPVENNHVGSYRREIIVPSDWKGKDIIAHFGSVSSNIYLWVNGKFVGYSEDSKLEADGITFHLKAVCTDSLRTKLSDEHADATPIISRICGPVEKVNDTTFIVSFYRMGMNNPRRTGDICLLASQTGDRKYKSAVQEVSIRIPYRNTEGQRQYILFPGLPDVKAESGSLSLKATSDCGLPVSYYIKEGPAEIEGDQIVFTPIPPRSKFPVKVTVVAWQYGIAGKVQTAEPVERNFYILK